MTTEAVTLLQDKARIRNSTMLLDVAMPMMHLTRLLLRAKHCLRFL